MSNNEILKSNKFANCTRSELLSLWSGLKRFYVEGRCADDNPLTFYKDAYCKEFYSMGVTLCEQDLLRAIACEFCG